MDEQQNYTEEEFEQYEALLRQHEEEMRAKGLDPNMVQPGMVVCMSMYFYRAPANVNHFPLQHTHFENLFSEMMSTIFFCHNALFSLLDRLLQVYCMWEREGE